MGALVDFPEHHEITPAWWADLLRQYAIPQGVRDALVLAFIEVLRLEAVSRQRGTLGAYRAAQRANRRNTIWLIVILIALAGTLGYLIGLVFDVYFTADPKQIDDLELAAYLTVPSAAGVIVSGGLMSIGLIASAVAFAAGGRVMMSLTGAEEVTKEQEPMLHNVVEEMAIAAGRKLPVGVTRFLGPLIARSIP